MSYISLNKCNLSEIVFFLKRTNPLSSRLRKNILNTFQILKWDIINDEIYTVQVSWIYRLGSVTVVLYSNDSIVLGSVKV